MPQFRIFFLFSLGLSLSLPAQVYIEGHVVDATTDEPVAYAHVLQKGTENGTITDTEGYFTLEVEEIPVILAVSEVAHHTRFERVLQPRVEIRLEAFTLELEDITVRREGEHYFKMANHVLDFAFYDDLILILGNSGREVRLINHRGQVQDRSLTPGKFHEIFKDCLNNLHLVGRDTAWQVYYDFEKLSFIHPHPRPVFERFLRNCECRYRDGLIYSMGRKRGLITTFLFASGGASMPFYEVGDSSSLRYLNQNYDLDYFVKQRNRGDMRYAMSLQEMEQELDDLQANLDLDWLESHIIYPSGYFVYPENNTLRVFALGIMSEFRFDQIQEEPERRILEIPEEHLERIEKDEATGYLYAVYNGNRGQVWVRRLDGPAEEVHISDYAFPSGTRIHDNHLFFVADPGIDGSNYLYRKNASFGRSD